VTGPTPAANAVTVGNNFFSPAATSVAAGTTVTWTWADGAVEHNVTFDDGGPNSPTQSSGSFARTFANSGTYAYHCTIHGAAVMHGTVTVGTSSGTGGSTGGSNPPPGGMGGGY
jgi:plastocyanin